MLSLLKNPTASQVSAEEFDRMMRESYRQAYAVAYRLTGNAADAEDLVQDAYLRAFRFIHRYDQSLPFLSWLYRILGNAHIDQVRRKKKHNHASIDTAGADGGQLFDVPDSAPTPDAQLLHEAYSDEMQAGMEAINPEFRMAVVLVDVEGMSYEEVAEIMQTSVGTVRSRIHRGRTTLRNYLVKNFPNTFGGAHVL